MGTQANRRALVTTGPQAVVKTDRIQRVEDVVLMPDTFRLFTAAVASVGTPVVVWTPATGMRWRVLGYTLSASAAGQAIFKEASVAASVGSRFGTPRFAANGAANSPPLGNGFAAASRNNQLVIDSDTAAVTYTGTVFGIEEAGD